MKKIITTLSAFLFSFLVFFPFAKIGLASVNLSGVEFSKDVTWVSFLPGKKDYRIAFSVPLPGEKKQRLRVEFKLPRGKEEPFLKWTETGNVSPELVKYVTVYAGKKRIKDRKTVETLLQSVYRSGAFGFPYFYILGRNGRVAEIQGVDDRLRLEIAARSGKLPDLSFLKQQVSISGMTDVLGVANEGSRRLGAKLGLRMPFFLALDDAVSAMGLARDVWRHLTRDARAEKLLESAASVRDRCLMILTRPAARVLNGSAKGLHEVLSACNEYLEKENLQGPELVRVAKAEGKTLFVLYFSHKKDVSRAEARSVLTTIEKARKEARNFTEGFRLDLFRVAAANAVLGK